MPRGFLFVLSDFSPSFSLTNDKKISKSWKIPKINTKTPWKIPKIDTKTPWKIPD